MASINFSHIFLEEIIDFSKSTTNGGFFTKKLINANKGEIPVYGASKDENEVGYGYVQDNLILKGKNGKNIVVKYFEDCLTWNIDGSVAVFYRKGRFSLSEKVIPLILFEEFKNIIDLEYLQISISQSKEINNFGFSNKAGKKKLREIVIKIPTKNNGEFDLKAQKEIVKKFKVLFSQQERLLEHKEKLENSLIEADFTNAYPYTEVLISDLFVPCNGETKYTKAFCNNHKGEFPVYSGNTKEAFAYIDSYDYDAKYITWCGDGLAGFIEVFDGKFSITNHRGILIPKNTTDIYNLDLDYLKFILEPIFRKNIKGRIGHNGQNEYTSLKPNAINKIKQNIRIPVKHDGSFDLKAQREIAKKFKKVEEIKKVICNKIIELTKTKIELE